MTPKISTKSLSPKKLFIFLKTPKNIEIQNFEPQKNGRSLRMRENIRVPRPPWAPKLINRCIRTFPGKLFFPNVLSYSSPIVNLLTGLIIDLKYLEGIPPPWVWESEFDQKCQQCENLKRFIQTHQVVTPL